MFPVKYVAVNDLTGYQIKTFRTKKGARRWYAKPMRFLDAKIRKQDIWISIYEVAR